VQILDYFRSLGKMGREMNPSAQIGRTLSSTVSAMVGAFDLDYSILLAAHGADGRLLPVAAYEMEAPPDRPIHLPAAARQRLRRRPGLRRFESLPRGVRELLAPLLPRGTNGTCFSLAPLVCGGEIVGFFLFGRKGEKGALDDQERDLLFGMCQNIAVYLYNQTVLLRLVQKHREIQELYRRTTDIYRQAVMAFLTAIDIKDGYTKQHSLRVAHMAAVVAREMGFPDHEVEGIYFAGLLHDIGKILVDKEILRKPGDLDLTEYAEMSQHTRLGAEILSQIRFPWENLVYTIRHHHDHPAYDEFAPPGRDGRLDVGTKIIGLTDAFDAMTSDRPYREALGLGESLREIVDGLGGQFDPEVVRVFFWILERDLDSPPAKRRILTERLLHREDEEAVRAALAEAILYVEQYMGIITAF